MRHTGELEGWYVRGLRFYYALAEIVGLKLTACIVFDSWITRKNVT